MINSKNSLKLLTSVLMLTSVSASADQYKFQTLNNNADPTFNQLLGVNDNGEIAGYFGSGNPGHPNQGYTLEQGAYTPENFTGSVQTQVTGLNNNGLTVGFWADQNNDNFGFVDNKGVFTNVVDPNTGTAGVQTNQLLAVNDHNIAAGFYVDANGVSHGDTYNILNHQFNEITINGATAVTAAAINNSNQVGGFYTNSAGVTEGFVQTGSNLQSIMINGEVSTEILGLNNKGMADGVVVDGNDAMHGFIYNINTGAYTIYDDPNGIGTTTFNGINDAGQVTGFYVDAAGNTDGLLASRIPEPSVLALISLAGLGMLLTSRRREYV